MMFVSLHPKTWHKTKTKPRTLSDAIFGNHHTRFMTEEMCMTNVPMQHRSIKIVPYYTVFGQNRDVDSQMHIYSAIQNINLTPKN